MGDCKFVKGRLIGKGKSNSVQVLLEPGVFRVSKQALKKYGVEFFEKINRGQSDILVDNIKAPVISKKFSGNADGSDG